MVNSSYLINGNVTDSTGANISGGTVVARDTTLDESTSVQTNSSGNYIIDLANLTSQWSDGDTVTVSITYGSEDAQEVITLSSPGPTTQNLVTATISVTAGTPTYCSVQDVLDALDGKTSTDISNDRVTDAILRAEDIIDKTTGTSWKVNTETDEVYNWTRYNAWRSPESLDSQGPIESGLRNDISNYGFNQAKLNNYPILSISSLSKNTAGSTSADSWTALTENTGSGGDFRIDKKTGYVTWFSNTPKQGSRAWKATYTWGASSVPGSVERVCILLSIQDVIVSKSTGSQFDNTDNIRLGEISISKGAASTRTYMSFIAAEIQNLFNQIGVTKAVEVI